jgi:hypothetical protein
MKYIAVVLALLLPIMAAGQTYKVVTATWINATVDDAGAPLAGETALEKTTLLFGECVAGDIPDPAATVDILAPATTGDVLPTSAALYCFRSTHTSKNGAVSDLSNLAMAQTVALPDFLTVIDGRVYFFVDQPNQRLPFPVGQVPPGTECIESETTNGKHAIPVDAVTWDSPTNTEFLVVYADCQ